MSTLHNYSSLIDEKEINRIGKRESNKYRKRNIDVSIDIVKWLIIWDNSFAKWLIIWDGESSC